jgi:hypothetical protein
MAQSGTAGASPHFRYREQTRRGGFALNARHPPFRAESRSGRTSTQWQYRYADGSLKAMRDPCYCFSAGTARRFWAFCEYGPRIERGVTSVMKSVLLSTALFFGVTAAANAMVKPGPIGNDRVIIKVAEGCGPGWWRGPHGRCHPMARGRACPPGYHLGPQGRRCWPN